MSEYLKCFIYLGFCNILRFFPLTFYEKLDWTKFEEYHNILIDKYDKILLCVQLNKFIYLSNEQYDKYTKEFSQPTRDDFEFKDIGLKLAEILLRTAIKTQNYYYLINVLIDAGYGILPQIENNDLYVNYKKFNETISEVSFNLLTSKNISDDAVQSILQVDKYPNILSDYILMTRYINSNNLNSAIEVFKKTKTCNTDIFVELFCLSNDEQRRDILTECHKKNKFASSFSNSYYRCLYVYDMILDIDKNNFYLNRIDIPLIESSYGHTEKNETKTNILSSSHTVKILDNYIIISYFFENNDYVIDKNYLQ